MDHFPVLFDLRGRQRRTTFSETMRRNGHNVSRAVGKPDAGAGKRNLHHVLRKVARRVQHVLVGRCDVAAGRVVISAEVGRNATSLGLTEQQRQEFERDGFLKVPGALPPSMVERLTEVVDRLYARGVAEEGDVVVDGADAARRHARLPGHQPDAVRRPTVDPVAAVADDSRQRVAHRADEV